MQWFGGWWGHYKSFTGKTWAKQELLIWYDSLGRWSVFDIICEHDTADVITVLSGDVFNDVEARREVLDAMDRYNMAEKKKKNRYLFRLADDKELALIQKEHVLDVLMALIQYDAYGRE